MFFRRIYSRGKRFKPSWQSYATYAAVIAACLLAVEFNVLNVFPGNPVGQLLLVVPAFYFIVAATFLLNDLFFAAMRRIKGKRR
jgi:uncharacterized membrane protein